MKNITPILKQVINALEKRAVNEEKYEEASKLRDLISELN